MQNEMNLEDVLKETGRMHLYIITLERQLFEANAKITALTPKPVDPPPTV